MIPYILLILIPIPFLFASVEKRQNNQLSVNIHKNSNSKNLLLYIFFLILLCMLALRGNAVGTDTKRYYVLFTQYGKADFKTLFSKWQEVLFRLLTHTIYKITDNFSIYLTIIALLEVVPLAYVYLRDREHSYLKMIIFVNMATFPMMFSGIRQAIAISFGVLAFDCVRKKKFLGYLASALIAFFFHASGIVVFLFYPICKLKIKRKHFYLIAAIVLFVFLFNKTIFSLLMKLYLMISPREYDGIISTGAVTTLILFILFLLFTFLISDDGKFDDEAFALRTMLIFTVLLQCFAPLHTLAMRVNYYFIALIPLALSKCLKAQNVRYEQVAKLGELVLCVFFTGVFIWDLFRGHITGVSALDIMPYIPFWIE